MDGRLNMIEDLSPLPDAYKAQAELRGEAEGSGKDRRKSKGKDGEAEGSVRKKDGNGKRKSLGTPRE